MQTDSTKEIGWFGGRLVYNCFDKDNNKVGLIGYYPAGGICFSYPIINDKFHGICKTWFESGKVQSEERYNNGVLELSEEHYENGLLSTKYSMRNNRRHGEHLEWYPDGKIKIRLYYNNGFLDGLTQSWYPNGILKAQAVYRMDKLHGSAKSWHDNGILDLVVNYEMNSRQGLSRQWHDNGKIKVEASYRNGVLNGIRKQYDRDGKLESESVFIRFVKIEGELKERILKNQLTAEYITKIRSAVIRRFCLEHFGYARFLTESKYEVTDKDGDRELVRIDWHRREEPLYLVRVRCPTLGIFYALRVPPHMKTARQAVAWTFDSKANNYLPLVET